MKIKRLFEIIEEVAGKEYREDCPHCKAMKAFKEIVIADEK